MIFANKMREIADVANEKKDKQLEDALKNICYDIVTETEKKIECAAADGRYDVSTCDLYDRLKIFKGVGQQLAEDGYSLTDVASRLACMIMKRFFECGFDVQTGRQTDNDCYCVYIAWDKEPQIRAMGRANQA